MKAIKYIPVIFMILLSGCDMDLQPISEIGEGDFYKNTSEVSSAVIACYNGLQEPMKYEWMFTELRSDNARLQNTATTSTANTQLMNFDQAKISSTNEYVYEYWLATYHNIARCNSVFKNLGVVDDPELRKQFEGEVSFIRAYHYFNLVRLFGPVFLVNERISAAEARQINRTPAAEIYAHVTSDLNNAIEKLQGITYDASNKGRITEWAAKGLLAKVRMTNGLNDEETKNLLYDIILHSGNRLQTASYASVFDINNEVNDEIIFTIRYLSGGFGLGSPFGNYFAPLQSGSSVINYSGNGYNYPSSDLAQSYSVKDQRMDATIALNYTDDRGNIVDRRYVTKYLSPVSLKEDGDKDWPVLRYSDILLLYAEVINELEGPSPALSYVNQTRTRAGLSELKDRDVPNKHEMRMAIEKERRLELAYENHRWFDLIRTNRAIEVLNSHFITETYYDEIRLDGEGNEIVKLELTQQSILLPIPQKELDINPNIPQNPGY